MCISSTVVHWGVWNRVTNQLNAMWSFSHPYSLMSSRISFKKWETHWQKAHGRNPGTSLASPPPPALPRPPLSWVPQVYTKWRRSSREHWVNLWPRAGGGTQDLSWWYLQRLLLVVTVSFFLSFFHTQSLFFSSSLVSCSWWALFVCFKEGSGPLSLPKPLEALQNPTTCSTWYPCRFGYTPAASGTSLAIPTEAPSHRCYP